MSESDESHESMSKRLVSSEHFYLVTICTTPGRTDLSSMNEDKLDSLKLDYIAQRSEKGRAAVEKLRLERSSYLQKAYRRGKDGVQEDNAKI